MKVKVELLFLLVAQVLLIPCLFSLGDSYEQYSNILPDNTSDKDIYIKINYIDNGTTPSEQIIKNKVIKAINNVSSYKILTNFTIKAIITFDGTQIQSPSYFDLNSTGEVNLRNSSFVIQYIMKNNIYNDEDNKNFIKNATMCIKCINDKYYIETNAPELASSSEKDGLIEMYIINDIVYGKYNKSWVRYYDPDIAKSLGYDPGMLINKTNSLNLSDSMIKGIEKCDGENCYRIEISPAMSMEELINRPDITFKDQILTFLASDVRMAFNETIWVSTDTYLLNKDIIEINIYMPKENKTYETHMQLYSISQYYDYNKNPEPPGEIILPKDAENAKWMMRTESETIFS